MEMRIIFSVFLFLISSSYFFYGFNYDFGNGGRPGAGFFPLILGAILTILCAINILLEVRQSKLEDKSTGKDRKFALKDMLIVAAMILIYMIIFPFLGYLISTALFILSVLGFLNSKRWGQNILIAVVLLLVIYFVFDYFLNTGLPKGILEGVF